MQTGSGLRRLVGPHARESLPNSYRCPLPRRLFFVPKILMG